MSKGYDVIECPFCHKKFEVWKTRKHIECIHCLGRFERRLDSQPPAEDSVVKANQELRQQLNDMEKRWLEAGNRAEMAERVLQLFYKNSLAPYMLISQANKGSGQLIVDQWAVGLMMAQKMIRSEGILGRDYRFTQKKDLEWEREMLNNGISVIQKSRESQVNEETPRKKPRVVQPSAGISVGAGK